ncbi:MAG TPA: 3'-5' exonuclease [Gemmatimonadales bacterium]|nr:3'-5' exonuclease [Gemmatimonadales bacterium]
MIGLEAHPATTLADRVLRLLGAEGPQSAGTLCGEVLGIPAAPAAVAERLAVALLAADPRVRQLTDGRWSLVAEACGSPLIEECAFAVVDVETTGMRAWGGDRITEIAIAVVHGARREIIFETLINPERRIPTTVARLTGISDTMVQRAPRFADVADTVLAMLGGRVFVAHNARFDWAFMGAELRRARDVVLDGPRLCTVKLARRLVRGIRSCCLDNLTCHFGFENPARHRAGGDAMVTAELLARLLCLARESGARTIHDLSTLETRPRQARRRGRPSARPTEPRADSWTESDR